MVYNDINNLIQTYIFYQEKVHLYFFNHHLGKLQKQASLIAKKTNKKIKIHLLPVNWGHLIQHPHQDSNNI